MNSKNNKKNKPDTKKPRKRVLQFGIRGLLLLTLLAAIGAWWWSQPEKQVEELAGGEFRIVRYVHFDDDGSPYRHGPWRLEERDGDVVTEGTYRLDKKHGAWTHWHSSGGKSSQGEYIADLREGVWRTWRIDGTLESETTFAQDVGEGPAKLFDPQGQLAAKGEFRAGQRVSVWHHYHANGQLAEQGEYLNNMRSGVFKNWDENGNPQVDTYFASGLPIADADQAAELWHQRLISSAGLEQIHACRVLIQLGEAAHNQLQATLQGDDAQLKSLVLRSGPPPKSAALHKDVIEILEDEDSHLRAIAMNCVPVWGIPLAEMELPLEHVLELEGNTIKQVVDQVCNEDELSLAEERFQQVVRTIALQETLPNGHAKALRHWAAELEGVQRAYSLAVLVAHLPADDELTRQLVREITSLQQEIDEAPTVYSMFGVDYGKDLARGWPLPLEASALPALLQFMRHAESSERMDAIKALSWMQKPSAEDAAPLVDFLTKQLDTQDEVARMSVVRALRGLGQAARPALPKLRRLRWTVPSFKQEAEYAIEAIDTGMAAMPSGSFGRGSYGGGTF